jgi:hypothetical protein
MIDAMIHGRIDLFLHHLRLRLILITPRGDFGLLMIRETGGSVPDQLPLCPGPAMDLLVPWIRMIVRKIVTTHPNTSVINH